MQHDHGYDTNIGWWTGKAGRNLRASPLGPIYGPYRRRKERLWLKGGLLVGLTVAVCWSVLHLVGIGG